MTQSYGPPEYVRVAGRDEIARVVDVGKNMGSPSRQSIYCWGLYFESTGEVAYYDVKKCERVDKP